MEFLIKHCSHAERVLELGSGNYSTPLFLNQKLFPLVRLLVSVESDQAWADKVAAANPDIRLELVVISEPIEDYLTIINLADYDLIFVDCGTSPEPRVKAIEYLARNVTTSKVVIHDYEQQEYRDAAKPFTHSLIDGFRTPHTAMVWK
jgi:hypothetical protein